jgi:Domain of unknown function (DUF1905)/Bacteriocin-protection, YdeI or OmpD-Associated
LIRFQARLEAHGGGSLVQVPREVSESLGGRARIPVRGTLHGLAFRGSTMPMGDGTHCLGFRKDQRAAAGVEIGELVTVELDRDEEERSVEVPDELAAALDSAGLRAAYDALSFTRRKEMAASTAGARRAETRERRIAAILEEVLQEPL